MGRLGSCLVASLVLHGVAWVYMAGRFSSWKLAMAGAAPPEPLEVEAVELPPPASPGGGSGGGAAPAVKHARTARARTQPAATPTEAAVAPAAPAPADSGGAGGGVGSSSGAGAGPAAGSGQGGGHGGVGSGGGGDLAGLIQARIMAHRRYPLLARKRGLEGTVEVVFRVDAAGNVVDLRVDKSGGNLFDAAAVDAVRAAAPLPPCAQPIRVPIRFRLLDERAIR